jgi:hypothetical protein
LVGELIGRNLIVTRLSRPGFGFFGSFRAIGHGRKVAPPAGTSEWEFFGRAFWGNHLASQSPADCQAQDFSRVILNSGRGRLGLVFLAGNFRLRAQ